jgi:energy-coupling factor transport system permease protein
MSRLVTAARGSFLARLDFRPKLLWAALTSFTALLWESPVANLGLASALFALCLFAGVHGRHLRLLFKVMAPFFALVLLTHGFWNVEQVKALSGHARLTPAFTLPRGLWLIGGASASVEGLLYGVSAIARTLSLVLVVPLVLFTTEVDRMIVALVRARVPYRLTFVFSSTLRFFPLLFDEIAAIIEAQRLRGLAFERLGPLARVRVYARVAVPLILGAMVRAQQLEVVLQSKAFSATGERTYLHDVALTRRDWIALAFGCVALLAVVALYYGYGVGRFTWPRR